ncbi:hypothetical protein MKEN_01162000 [Mycena kentingensis (nom. inval.)]|nr:hypothetical protein MKEN_01162000 [Mycena kentingensis (nom. inval.)]
MPGRRLPAELERAILLTTTEIDPKTLPSMLLIAKRAHLWLEPQLYKDVRLRMGSDPAQDAFFRVASTRPRWFLAHGVRRLRLSLGYPTPGRAFLRQVYDAVSLCTGVREVSLNPAGVRVTRNLFELLAPMRPHHLGAFINRLTDRQLDCGLPIFSQLTHISVFWHDNINSDHRIIPFVCGLPSLTHLSFQNALTFDNLRQILNKCAFLQTVVFLLAFTGNELTCPETTRAIEWAETIPFRDSRIVVSVGTRTDNGMMPQRPLCWKAAEEFQALKTRGEIAEDRLWTGDFWTRSATEDPVAILLHSLLLCPSILQILVSDYYNNDNC